MRMRFSGFSAFRSVSMAAMTAAIIIFGPPASAQGSWLDRGTALLEDLGGTRETPGLSTGGLSIEELGAGLREALRVGTERVVAQLGKADGYNADPAIHIPLPGQLDTVKTALGGIGMGGLLDDLELKLNRAAETAAPKAKEHLWSAIGQMSFEDAKAIYSGPEDAATRYFQEKMTAPLTEDIRPVVEGALSEAGAVQAYDTLMAQYASVPFAPDVKANLTDYAIEKGLDGLFHYIALEEAAIRQDPARRTTELLERVFGTP
uniref:DUF4197 domain-containing protein n=1 Tax=Candidatus Kentrum sp. FM TaxID=2126340 RepID=A0A450TZI7_9GAMM|nr:MAG: Protein of unknown function (DUF4197) [Candidatus Kentron sp. FM]VFJ75489.1 MAG: Protein of unknown function (DUF4197) [Candidatus Kentron sp. FM]VFK21895.1 MAG: Protein of unknown function (DUF4197) [Candidatus Kentron sp. FM]